MAVSDHQIFKEVCENDFSFFVRAFLKVVEPETEFEWNWHIETLCHYCERVYYGDYQNLDINIPPRMMKSMIVTVLFPCWVWTKDQSKKFIVASCKYDLAIKFNQQRRDLINSEAYQDCWPIVLKDDQDKAIKFANYRNGFMQAASALGKIIGTGADFLLSDDLLDVIDAFSKTKREATNHWFSNAFYNRLQSKKKGKRININQRLHINDVSGHIAENHNYKTLILPMQAVEKNESTVDFKDPRKVGEFLFPARYGEEEKADDLKGMGIASYSSQYGQSPRPIGGGIIKTEWIRYYKVAPTSFKRKLITADLNFGGGENPDYVSFMVWGETYEGFKYLLSVVRGKWTYKVAKEMFKTFCALHDAPYKWIEAKANGPALISDLGETIPGLKAWPDKINGKANPLSSADKVQRLHLCSQDFEIGSIFFNENDEITKELVDELTSFTEKGSATGNDDMVDTTTMAILEFKKATTFAIG